MDDRYTVETPENIEFAYDIAGIGSRFLAAIIDTLLIVVALAIVFFVAFLIAEQFDPFLNAESLVIALSILLASLILGGYYVIFELLWNGQSPGKRLIGLRVVREGGRPISFVASLVRNLIRLVDFLPVLYGIGVVVMFIDRRARRLGDLAGGTLVVKERRDVTLDSLLADQRGVQVAPDYTPTLTQVYLLNDQDYDLVQEFLRRRDELSRDARARLGAQIAAGLQVRLGIPQGGDAERFLQYVALEYQAYRRQASAGDTPQEEQQI